MGSFPEPDDLNQLPLQEGAFYRPLFQVETTGGGVEIYPSAGVIIPVHNEHVSLLHPILKMRRPFRDAHITLPRRLGQIGISKWNAKSDEISQEKHQPHAVSAADFLEDFFQPLQRFASRNRAGIIFPACRVNTRNNSLTTWVLILFLLSLYPFRIKTAKTERDKTKQHQTFGSFPFFP